MCTTKSLRLQIVVLLVNIFVVTGYTQNDKPRLLTLQKTIEIAREQSPDALIAKHSFRASYWWFRSYQASYLPALTAYGYLPDFDRSIRTISTVEGDVFSAQTRNVLYGGLSLNQKIGLTGGTLSLNSNLSRLDNIYQDPDTTISQYSSSIINVTYNQPIFQYNSFKWERLIEPMKYEESKKRYIENMEKVSVVATNYFFNLLLAQIKERIALINQANYDTMFKIAEGRYNLGKIAENDLLQLELQLLRANSDAQQTKLDAGNRLFQLKSYLRIQDDIDIDLILPNNFKPFDVNAAKAIEEARTNNSDVLAFKRRLLEAESDVDRAKKDGRLDADLFMVYGLTNNSEQLVNINNNPLDQQQFRLGVTLPILDWGVAKGRIKMAMSEQELVHTSIEQEQIDFDQEIFLKVARFNMQYDQVLIAAKADTVAAKGYEVTKARYLIGRISITDLNIAQTETDNSKSNYINALRTLWTSYFEIRQYTLFDFKNNLPIIVNHKELLSN